MSFSNYLMLELHKRDPQPPQEADRLQREIAATDGAIDKLVRVVWSDGGGSKNCGSGEVVDGGQLIVERGNTRLKTKG